MTYQTDTLTLIERLQNEGSPICEEAALVLEECAAHLMAFTSNYLNDLAQKIARRGPPADDRAVQNETLFMLLMCQMLLQTRVAENKARKLKNGELEPYAARKLCSALFGTQSDALDKLVKGEAK